MSPLSASYLPDLIVSEKGAIAVKAGPAYQFWECAEGRAALVLVSELLSAVTAATTRSGAIGDQLADALVAAVRVHSVFLEADKTKVLEDLPI